MPTPYIRDNLTTMSMSRVLSLLLLFLILTVYWPVLTYPFVGDDWFHMNYFVNHSNRESLEFCFKPWKDIVSFRPIGYLYMLLLYNLFGLNPIAFKVFGLFFHFINSLLIVYIVRKILRDPVIAWATGLLYANAIKVHIQPMVWCTGFFDLGGAFFFYSSFALFLKGRYKMSAMAYLLALFTKPATGTLPLILLFYEILSSGEDRKMSLIQPFYKLWPHFLIFLVYSIRFIPYVMFALPHIDPINLDFFGLHLFKKFTYYVSWGIPAIFTFKTTTIVYLLFFIVLIIFIRLKQSNTHVEYRKYKSVFWIIWFILGLVPPCLISSGDRQSSYFLTYSLSSFIVLFLLFVRLIAIRYKCKEKQLTLIITVTVAFSFVSSALYSFERNREGIYSKEFMIRGAHTIKIIHDKLLEVYPSLPKGAVLVFERIKAEGINLYWYFSQRHDAPRTWYRDNTLEVCRIEDLHATPNNIHIKISVNGSYSDYYGGDIKLDSRRSFFLVSWNDRDVYVREVSLQELYKLSDLN